MREDHPNTPDDFLDHCYYWIIKVVPRLLIVSGIVWIVISIDRYSLDFLVALLLGYMLFYFFPPTFTLITILPNSNHTDNSLILYKLYTAAQKLDGIYNINNYFLIKSHYGKAVEFYKLLDKNYNFNKDEYNIKLHKWRAKDLIEESQRIVRNLFVDHYGIDVAYAIDVNVQSFREIIFSKRYSDKL